jgi:hypothetical protein
LPKNVGLPLGSREQTQEESAHNKHHGQLDQTFKNHNSQEHFLPI